MARYCTVPQTVQLEVGKSVFDSSLLRKDLFSYFVLVLFLLLVKYRYGMVQYHRHRSWLPVGFYSSLHRVAWLSRYIVLYYVRVSKGSRASKCYIITNRSERCRHIAKQPLPQRMKDPAMMRAPQQQSSPVDFAALIIFCIMPATVDVSGGGWRILSRWELPKNKLTRQCRCHACFSYHAGRWGRLLYNSLYIIVLRTT